MSAIQHFAVLKYCFSFIITLPNLPFHQLSHTFYVKNRLYLYLIMLINFLCILFTSYWFHICHPKILVFFLELRWTIITFWGQYSMLKWMFVIWVIKYFASRLCRAFHKYKKLFVKFYYKFNNNLIRRSNLIIMYNYLILLLIF